MKVFIITSTDPVDLQDQLTELLYTQARGKRKVNMDLHVNILAPASRYYTVLVTICCDDNIST